MFPSAEAEKLIRDLTAAYLEVGEVLTGRDVDTGTRSSRFPDLAVTARKLAAYAWEGQWDPGSCELTEALAELSTAIQLIKGDLMLPGGETLFPEAAKDDLQRLANAANARHHLAEGEPITIEWLAALAGIAEKTVRAATNPTNASPLNVTKDGHWSWIEAEEALSWLSKRPTFKPTRMVGQDVNPEMPSRFSDLRPFCEYWLLKSDRDVADLMSELAWPPSHQQAFASLLRQEVTGAFPALEPELLRRFAEGVGMPQPSEFAHHAYRLMALEHAEQLSRQQLRETSSFKPAIPPNDLEENNMQQETKSPLLFDIWAFDKEGQKVYPYRGKQGSKRGLFSVNFTNDTNKFHGMTAKELVDAIESGRFRERGTIRMCRATATSGSNAFAPIIFRGRPVKHY